MKRVLRGVGFVGLFAVMALIAALQAAVRAMQRGMPEVRTRHDAERSEGPGEPGGAADDDRHSGGGSPEANGLAKRTQMNELPWRLLMKPAIALLALFTVACGGSSGGPNPSPTEPTTPTEKVSGGQWGMRAGLIEANSELAVAEANGKLYLLGGYPASRVTARTVQVYDIANDRWDLGPPLPQPNNHGMAAGVNGRVYLIGGQTSDISEVGHVDTVYELDPGKGEWVEKARMPTARSSGVAVVHGGKIYVAGGRPPRGSDFAVYDPTSDSWQVLPNLPSQRNHLTGAAISGRIHVLGGRLGHGLSAQMTPVNEVFDPQTGGWTTAAPMLEARSGMNGVMARGCFHVWGGEGPAGMFADHDYYDPRTDKWIPLHDMAVAVHGVYGSAFVNGLIWAPGGGTNIGGNFGSTHNQVFSPTVSCE